MTTNREYTYYREDDAHIAQRSFIIRGHIVSMVAFDPSRGLYAFDVLKD